MRAARYRAEVSTLTPATPFKPDIPKTCDDAAMETLEFAGQSEVHPTSRFSQYYHRIPVRPIYKSYPVYAPERAPGGYLEQLKRAAAPEIIFNPATLKTEQDWIKVGEAVFDAPTAYDGGVTALEDVSDPEWYARTGA